MSCCLISSRGGADPETGHGRAELDATFDAVKMEVADLDGLAPWWGAPVVQPMLEQWVRAPLSISALSVSGMLSGVV